MMAVRFTILVLLTTAVVVVSSAGLLGEQHEYFFLAVQANGRKFDVRSGQIWSVKLNVTPE